jgi:ParB family chromosome partitioning protein
VDPHIEALIQSLSKKLESKTEIKQSDNNKGKIVIHYKSAEELNNILKHIN